MSHPDASLGLAALRAQRDAAERLAEHAPALLSELRKALDSLEYVEANYPGLSGYGVRQARIASAKNLIEKLEAIDA